MRRHFNVTSKLWRHFNVPSKLLRHFNVTSKLWCHFNLNLHAEYYQKRVCYSRWTQHHFSITLFAIFTVITGMIRPTLVSMIAKATHIFAFFLLSSIHTQCTYNRVLESVFTFKIVIKIWLMQYHETSFLFIQPNIMENGNSLWNGNHLNIKTE